MCVVLASQVGKDADFVFCARHARDRGSGPATAHADTPHPVTVDCGFQNSGGDGVVFLAAISRWSEKPMLSPSSQQLLAPYKALGLVPLKSCYILCDK